MATLWIVENFDGEQWIPLHYCEGKPLAETLRDELIAGLPPGGEQYYAITDVDSISVHP